MFSSAHNPVILTYHSISSGPSPIEISPEQFEQHMRWLAAQAQVVSLAELVAALSSHKPLPSRTAVLTFDDGFADFAAVAAPILKQHRFPATVFLATAHVGKTNAWPGQPDWVRPAPLMSWEQVAELSRQGIDFGAHSVSHPDLVSLAPEALVSELQESQREIQSRTQSAAECFCYPYGRWNAAVRNATKRFYKGACSTAAGIVESNADIYALPRVDAHYVRSMGWFRKMFTPAFVAYIATRRMIRRLRGQPEGHYSRA